MKILCISYAYAPSVGGIETMSKTLATAWRQMGHEVKIVTHTEGSGVEDAAVIRQPTFMELNRLFRWCDSCFMNNVSLRYAFPCLLSNKTTITAQKVPDLDGGSSLTRMLKNLAYSRRRAVAISTYIAREVPGASVVIPNCYDDDLFKTVTPWEARDRDIVVLSRLVSEKGVAVAVRAIKVLADRGRACSLTIVGKGPEEDSLRDLANQLGLEGQVEFAGAMHGEALCEVLNRHKVHMVPSVYQEPFGIVCLEGIACGCAVVGSDAGGIPDALGPCGALFTMGDAGAAADAVQRFLDLEQYPYASEAPPHLARHTAGAVANSYISVFQGRTGE